MPKCPLGPWIAWLLPWNILFFSLGQMKVLSAQVRGEVSDFVIKYPGKATKKAEWLILLVVSEGSQSVIT